MRRCVVMSLLLGAVLALTSCAPIRSGTYTLASTTCGADVLGGKFILVAKNVTVTDTKPVFILPLGTPRDYKAMDEILATNKGDLLTNVRITSKSNLVYLIAAFGVQKVTVSADVWRLATIAEIADPAGRQLCTLDECSKLGDTIYHGRNGGGNRL